MLIPMPPEGRRRDPILSMLASMDSRSPDPKEERVGIYHIDHFGSSDFLRSFEHYPDFDPIAVTDNMPAQVKEDAYEGMVSRDGYGVCDSVEQLLAHFPELEAPGSEFVVTLTELHKADQPSSGGWRWHKWGPYIGTHEIQCEYLYNEVGIESVLIYHIYERIDYDAMTTEQLKELYKKKYYRDFGPDAHEWIGEDDAQVRVALLRAFRRGA